MDTLDQNSTKKCLLSALVRCLFYRELMYEEMCYIRLGPDSCVRLREVYALRELTVFGDPSSNQLLTYVTVYLYVHLSLK